MIVYLHGFASSPQSKKARFFVERLAQRGEEAVVPDLAPDFEDMTLTGQLERIEKAAAGREVALMGSSMGGYLAALYAARHPEVSKVVCLAPAFDFAARWSARLGIEEMAQWKERGWLPVFHYGQQREARVGYGLFEDSLRYEAYPDVRQSCLVFHGLQDDVVPVEVSEEFARRHPDTARLLRMDSGHELIDVLEPMWEETWRFLSH